jgi:serine phosphatase RsbU (regulator of sigma subunit)
MPDNHYETLELRLEPGDSILLYSNGRTGACNTAQEEWRLGRLQKVKRSLLRDMHVAARELLARLGAFRSDAGQHDNITLLLLQRLPADLPVTVAVTGTQHVNQ